MKTPRFIYGTLALLLLAATAHAQQNTLHQTPVNTPLSDPGILDSVLQGLHRPIESFGDLSGDSAESPIQTRSFELSIPRAHLLGDWAGILPKLEDFGITPTLSYMSNLAGNPTGGRSQGFTYTDNIGFQLDFDLNKIAGIDGASFLVSMSQRNGASDTHKFIGNTFTVQQVYGGQTFHLIDVAYNQKLFHDRVDFSIGRIAAGDDFLVCVYDYLFMQNGFDGNPVGIFFNAPGMSAYPNATWGARLRVRPTDRTYVMGGVYNGDASIRADDNHGADMSLGGPVFAMMEAGYIRNGLPGDSQMLGHYKVGGWYDGNTYTNYNSAGYSTPTRTKQGNWGFYGMFDQVMIPFGEPKSNRGLGIFGSALISPDQSVSQMPFFFTAGVACRGIAESRSRDVLGLGVVYGEFSSDLAHSQEREQLLNPTIGVQRRESVIELTYRINSANGAVFFQPDLQYVIRPGGTGQYNDALVLGAQIGINF